jgi:protease-4
MARLFQSSTERVYRQFLNLVKDSRPLLETIEDVDAVAQGRVWSGEQALEHQLIDKTGTFQDAIEASARIAGLGDDYRVDWVEPKRSALDEFFMEFLAGAVAKFNLSISTPFELPGSWLQSMLDDLQFIAAKEGKFTVAAYCLCGIQ